MFCLCEIYAGIEAGGKFIIYSKAMQRALKQSRLPDLVLRNIVSVDRGSAARLCRPMDMVCG